MPPNPKLLLIITSIFLSMHGHALGGAGGIEAAISLKAMQEGIVPPTINIENLDSRMRFRCYDSHHIIDFAKIALNGKKMRLKLLCSVKMLQKTFYLLQNLCTD